MKARSQFAFYWPSGHPNAGELAFVKVRTNRPKAKYMYQWSKPPGADDVWYIAVDGRDLPGPREVLYLCEGERDADAVAAAGAAAIAHHQGAGKTTEGQVAQLRGRTAKTYVAVDRDPAGWVCADRRYRQLIDVGIPRSAIVVVAPVPRHEHADVRDHLEGGWSLDDLVVVSPRLLAKRADRARRGPREAASSRFAGRVVPTGEAQPLYLMDFDGYTVGPRPKPNEEWATYCPVHETPGVSKSPSASLRVDADGDGVWCCHSALCGKSGVVAAEPTPFDPVAWQEALRRNGRRHAV